MTTKNLRQKKLPQTRESVTHEFVIDGIKAYITVGLYPDGSPGEIFIDAAKEGSTISGLLDTVAISISMGLQYGIPIQKFVDKFSYMSFPPQGFVKDNGYASSIIDYIFKWIGKYFDLNQPKKEKHIEEKIAQESLKNEEKISEKLSENVERKYIETPSLVTQDHNLGLIVAAQPTTSLISASETSKWFLTNQPSSGTIDAPPCKNCGGLTQRAGSCYCCTVCGETSGCS